MKGCAIYQLNGAWPWRFGVGFPALGAGHRFVRCVGQFAVVGGTLKPKMAFCAALAP